MAAIKISANEYLKGLKWSLMPKNSIDTIKGTYITNEVSDEDEVVASTVIKKVLINNEYVNLPVSENTALQYTSSARNNGKYTNQIDLYTETVYVETAYSRLGAAFAEISTVLKTEKPVTSNASLEIVLSGVTKKITHSSVGYDSLDMSSFDAVYNAVKNQEEETFMGDSEGQNYSSNKVVIAPFLKADVADNAQVSSDQLYTQWDRARTQSGILTIITQEVGDSAGWDYKDTASAVRAKGSITNNVMYYMKSVINIVTSFEQVDQYTFRVNLRVPIKVLGGGKARAVKQSYTYTPPSEYSPASTTILYSGGDLVDSFAFLDMLKEITINIKGRTVSTDAIDFGYSLDNEGQLTDTLRNLNVFNFVNSELVTLRTVWGSEQWMQRMSKYILDEYVRGKYQVEFDMYLPRAIQKNISVNSQLKVYQLNDTPIRRNDRDVVFFVKTIEKQVDNKGFIAHIKAVEGASENVDTMQAALIYMRYANNSELMSPGYLVDIRNNAPTLQVTDNEDSYNSNALTRYGYSVALTSPNTIVEPNMLLPGALIGPKVAIIVRMNIEYIVSNIQLGLINSELTKIVDEEIEKFSVPNVSGQFFYVGLVNIGNNKSNLSLYVKLGSFFPGKVAVNIYNLYNYNVTKAEIMRWVLANNKEPQFSE